MKQIDWIEELDKKKRSEFILDNRGRLRLGAVDKKGWTTVYYEKATSSASTPSYKIYYDTTSSI